MNILCVVAHRDDECLGAAGTLARLRREGHDLVVCYLGTYGLCRPHDDIVVAAARAREVLSAGLYAGTLFPDNRFDLSPLLAIVQEVEAAIEREQPGVIYTHQPHDLNVDHRLTCQAVLTATRPTPGQSVKAVYGFEVPSSTEWAFGAPAFQPNVFVDISETLDTKLAALRCYASELRPFPHPRSEEAVVARARYWGSVAGIPAAEAFVLLREVRA